MCNLKRYRSVPLAPFMDIEKKLKATKMIETFSIILLATLKKPTLNLTCKSKNKFINYKTYSSILISIDTFVNVATNSFPVSSSAISFALLVLPKNPGVACGLSITDKDINESVVDKIIE